MIWGGDNTEHVPVSDVGDATGVDEAQLLINDMDDGGREQLVCEEKQTLTDGAAEVAVGNRGDKKRAGADDNRPRKALCCCWLGCMPLCASHMRAVVVKDEAEAGGTMAAAAAVERWTKSGSTVHQPGRPSRANFRNLGFIDRVWRTAF